MGTSVWCLPFAEATEINACSSVTIVPDEQSETFMPYIKKCSFCALVFVNIFKFHTNIVRDAQLNTLKNEFRISRKTSCEGWIQAFEVNFAETFCPTKGQTIKSSSQLSEFHL